MNLEKNTEYLNLFTVLCSDAMIAESQLSDSDSHHGYQEKKDEDPFQLVRGGISPQKSQRSD